MKRNKPNIAIFHNYMDNIGGAEKFVLNTAKELDSDIYTTNIDKKKIIKMNPDIDLSRIKSIGKVPLNSPYRQQLALFLFSRLNLKRKYDLYIIAGDWALSSALHNKPNIWYVHSPIREIWDLYSYVRKNIVRNWVFRILFDVWVKYNRYLNLKYVRHVNILACNSINTQKRVKKYLNRDSVVLYSPLDVDKFQKKQKKEIYENLRQKIPKNYWLSVNRLFFHKRVEIQIEAFRNLPKEHLIIVGSYEKSKHFTEYAKKIIRNKPKNVTILSWVDDAKLIELYKHCTGFITTSQDEDFGITPIEAMAAGKPVIAANEGAFKETVINGKTGILIDNITSKKLVIAIKKMALILKNNPYAYEKNCLKRAKEFETKKYVKNINKIISELI